MSCLVLTNGDSAADLLKASGKDARIEPWRDSLNEGPLSGLSSVDDFHAFRETRATYWSKRGITSYDDQIERYQSRDAVLESHQDFERIELWFEHDLYDQLQLIEILTRLYHVKRFDEIYLVQAERYLGMMTPDSILSLEDLTQPVNEQMMAIADLAWQVVSHDTPSKLAEFVGLKPAGFPFLAQALRRFLEELPGRDGLSRTERQMLYSIQRGVRKPGPLFARCQAMEAAQFWGDWGFFHVLSQLQFCEKPLLEGLPEPITIAVFENDERRKGFIQADLSLTSLGLAVLDGGEDHCEHNAFERSVGGTLVCPSNLWRFDADRSELTAPLLTQ